QRVGEVGMIEQVENVYAKLQFQMLAQFVVLHQAQIEVLEVRPDKGVAPDVPKMLGAGNAVAAGIQRAWHFEGAQVDIIERRAGAGKRIAHQVGPPEKLSAAVEVAFEQI